MITSSGKGRQTSAKDLARGLNGFGMRLLQALATGEDAASDGNVILSGLSLGLALIMTYWGARGETAREIAQTLGLPQDADSHAAARSLMADLTQTSPEITLHLANALWCRLGFQLDPAYVGECVDALGAALEALDFSDPSARLRINGWVADATQGAIEELIPGQIHPLTMLFITNALYFAGQWAEPFDVNLTKQEPFSCWDGTERVVAMMHREGKMSYAESERFQSIRLDFSGEALTMDIILPRQRNGLANLLADTDETILLSIPAAMRQRPGRLAMPRLNLANKWNLAGPLFKLGMQQAFDAARADFRGMTGSALLDGLHVSRVLHNTMFRIDETGAKAAAATAVEMRLRGFARPEPPFTMVVDHAFLFVLRDRRRNAVLMQGTVGDPSSTSA